MSDNHLTSNISLNGLKPLNSKDEWRPWIKKIRSWITDRDYDEPLPIAPIGVATRSSAPVDDESYQTELAKYQRNQKKAINGILDVCGNRANTLAQGLATWQEVIATLEKHFKKAGDILLADLEVRVNGLSLSAFDDLTGLNNELDDIITEYAQLGFPLNRPQQVTMFIGALGRGFDSWKTSFNQQHHILQRGAVKGVTLADAQESALIEEQRLKADIQKETAHLATTRALFAKELNMNLNQNGKRRFDGDQRPRDRPRCPNCVSLGNSDNKHPLNGCWIANPHLKAEWEAKNPERASLRRKREAQLVSTLVDSARPPTTATTASSSNHTVHTPVQPTRANFTILGAANSTEPRKQYW
jgi:hypothetical protein